MFDTERFILAVEKRQVLWNTDRPSTATTGDNRELKMKAWDEIGAEMYANKWNLFSSQEKLDKHKLLHKKWKNVRDYFLKDLNAQMKQESGASVPKYRKYLYYDLLLFLQPVIQAKRRQSKGNDLNSSVVDNPPSEPPKEIEVVSFDKHEKIPSTENTVVEEKPPKRTFLKRESTDEEEVDADKAFFSSLVPTMKKLNDQQKLDLKLEILQAVKKIKNPSSQSNPAIDKTFLKLPLYFQCSSCQSFSSISPQTSIDCPRNDHYPSSSSTAAVSHDMMDTLDSFQFKVENKDCYC